ncbi:MAG: M20/M25/M40 family metallo-hydrolase [Chloroflexi bacterium]|nr:M20/M25/M40 family metallo-hydrolase [Chloroflexota bacterium]
MATKTKTKAKKKTARPIKVTPPTAAQADSLALLKQLSEAVAVSGDEGAVRKIIREAVTNLADEVSVDAMGNLFAIKHAASSRAPRVLVTAHLDEIGFMIVGEGKDGLHSFEAVGGIDDRILLGKPLWVGENKINGVIGFKPIHLVKQNERSTVVKIDSLKVDVGANRTVKAGDRATFATPFVDLGFTVRGKALDDRAGCAVLVEILRGKYPVELIAAFTVQEEVGLRGAKVAGYTAEPDAAIVIDCTPANDLPSQDDEVENSHYNTKLGHGPAIYSFDRGTVSDKRLIKHLAATAESKRIPYQHRQPGGGGTDAGAIHLTRGGVPSVSVSVPGRYLHSPAALMSKDDFYNTAKLVRVALESWSPKVLKR